MQLLNFSSVSFTYGDTALKTIDDISFEINAGDFLGIIGPNGAGKSTLFKLATGFLKPQQGAINLKGKDIHSYSRRNFARIAALLPQFLDVYFPFTVEEFVSMGRFPYTKRWESISKEDKEIIENSLAETETAELRSRLLSQLSGGERQRVLLAQALCQSPELILLDEPIAHLDIGHQIKVMDLLKKLNSEQKITIAVILHDLNIASEYSSSIMLMENGRIFTKGSAKEVLTYENVEKVYRTMVVVKDNPISKKPHILPVSNSFRTGNPV